MKAPAAGFSNPTWAPAAKDMVGASLGSSRLWFTVAEGIVTEVYYPRIDIPQVKDLGFIIADDRGIMRSNIIPVQVARDRCDGLFQQFLRFRGIT